MYQILFADDDVNAREAAKARLENDLYHILLAENGKECIRKSKYHRPDVIILDIIMPDLECEETLDILKSDKQTQDIPTILITGHVLESRIIKRISPRVNGFMSKPLKYEIIKQEIAKLTVHKSQDHENEPIIHSIEFPPGYHQAGLGILNYFSEIISQQYPNIPVTIRIEQEGHLIRMVIETSGDHREIVERSLHTYSLVIAGQAPPSELLSDPIHILALENQLEMTKKELRMTQQMLQHSNISYRNLQAKLQDLHILLVESLRHSLKANEPLINQAIRYTRAHDDHFQKLVDRASDNAELFISVKTIQVILEQTLFDNQKAEFTESDKSQLADAISQIKDQDITYWNELKDEILSFVRGAGSGVRGNILTEIIQLLY